MALTELIFRIQKAEVGLVQFDASISETHNRESEITEHPVEFGANVTDHVRARPKTIEINGLITDTPVVFLASLLAESPVKGSFIPSFSRVGDAYDEFERMIDFAQTVDVVTSLTEYSNMAIESCSVVRDASRGNVLDCSLSLKEIVIASALTIGLPIPLNAANKAATNAGKKPKTPPTDSQSGKSQSLLSQLLG